MRTLLDRVVFELESHEDLGDIDHYLQELYTALDVLAPESDNAAIKFTIDIIKEII